MPRFTTWYHPAGSNCRGARVMAPRSYHTGRAKLLLSRRRLTSKPKTARREARPTDQPIHRPQGHITPAPRRHYLGRSKASTQPPCHSRLQRFSDRRPRNPRPLANLKAQKLSHGGHGDHGGAGSFALLRSGTLSNHHARLQSTNTG